MFFQTVAAFVHHFSAAFAADYAIMDSGRFPKFSPPKSPSATPPEQQQQQPQSPSGGMNESKPKDDVGSSNQTRPGSPTPPSSPPNGKMKVKSDHNYAKDLKPPFTQRPDSEAEDTDQEEEEESSSSSKENSSGSSNDDDDDDETDDSDDEDYWTYKPLVAYCGECFNVQIHEPNYKDEHKTCLCFWGDAVCCVKGFEFYLKENSTKGIFPCPKMTFFAKYSHFIMPYEDPKLQRACRLAFDKAKQKKQKK